MTPYSTDDILILRMKSPPKNYKHLNPKQGFVSMIENWQCCQLIRLSLPSFVYAKSLFVGSIFANVPTH